MPSTERSCQLSTLSDVPVTSVETISSLRFNRVAVNWRHKEQVMHRPPPDPCVNGDNIASGPFISAGNMLEAGIFTRISGTIAVVLLIVALLTGAFYFELAEGIQSSYSQPGVGAAADHLSCGTHSANMPEGPLQDDGRTRPKLQRHWSAVITSLVMGFFQTQRHLTRGC